MSSQFKVSADYTKDNCSDVKSTDYCWKTTRSAPSSSCDTSHTSSTLSGVNGVYYLYTRARDSVNTSLWRLIGSYLFDNTNPTIRFVKVAAKSQSAMEVEDSVMMSYDNTQEVLEETAASETEEVVNEEVQVNEDSMMERKALVKVMNNEVIQVEHNHIPSTVSMLDYVLGSLKSSIVIGGTYLFIKQRKRVNVS